MSKKIYNIDEYLENEKSLKRIWVVMSVVFWLLFFVFIAIAGTVISFLAKLVLHLMR